VVPIQEPAYKNQNSMNAMTLVFYDYTSICCLYFRKENFICSSILKISYLTLQNKQHPIPTQPLRTYTIKLEKYVKTIFLSAKDANHEVHD
jgi:hypothetical protein